MIVEYNLKKIRQNNGLSLRKLEFLSGVSKSQLNAIEKNKTHPTVFTLCMIAATLNIEPCELFTVSIISDR